MSAFERHAGAIIAALFFAGGVAISGDIGATADERETHRAAVRNTEILSAALEGQELPEWSFHEVTGFYFAVDTARGLWLRTAQAAGVTDSLRAMHVANLLLASLTLLLLHKLALLAGGSVRTATLATLALALLPKFFAHSQNNPKDLPATFAVTLALHAMLKAVETAKARDVISAGGALGFALTTRVHALFVLPIAGLWLSVTRERLQLRDVTSGLAILAVAAIAVLALWPWLWSAPLDNLALAFTNLSSKVFTFSVLYLGDLYSANEIPWHYRTVQFLATTPLLVTALALLGIASIGGSEVASGERRLAVLGAVWTLVYFFADSLVFSRYDVVRHFLVALPGVALLVGAGASFALELATGRRAARAIVGVAFASSAAAILSTYPYANSYINLGARSLCDGDCDRSFEIEYWAQSYLEATDWLLANAPAGSDVVVPFFEHVAAEYLGDSPLAVHEGSVREWEARDNERYLVLLSRRAWWTPQLEQLADTETPVFEIRRSGGRLLAIYSNARLGEPAQQRPAATGTQAD